MSTSAPTYDVFLSCGKDGADIAAFVEQKLSESGLTVFNICDAHAGEPIVDVLWEALAESAALVAIITPSTEDRSSLAVEVGAALAWHKPVYVLTQGEVTLPSYLAHSQARPASEIAAVAREIRRGSVPLSDDHRRILMDLYRKMAIPTDLLIRRPKAIDRLTNAFRKATGLQYPGERLLRELLRLRKQAMLPTLRRRN